MSEIKWTRTGQSGEASETLTLVRIDGEETLGLERCTGPEIWDLVALYDLDGHLLKSQLLVVGGRRFGGTCGRRQGDRRPRNTATF